MNDSKRFSMELDDNRRKLLEKIDGKIEGNTKTASVVRAMKLALDWDEKKQEAMEEKGKIDERWSIDGNGN